MDIIVDTHLIENSLSIANNSQGTTNRRIDPAVAFKYKEIDIGTRKGIGEGKASDRSTGDEHLERGFFPRVHLLGQLGCQVLTRQGELVRIKLDSDEMGLSQEGQESDRSVQTPNLLLVPPLMQNWELLSSLCLLSRGHREGEKFHRTYIASESPVQLSTQLVEAVPPHRKQLPPLKGSTSNSYSGKALADTSRLFLLAVSGTIYVFGIMMVGTCGA